MVLRAQTALMAAPHSRSLTPMTETSVNSGFSKITFRNFLKLSQRFQKKPGFLADGDAGIADNYVIARRTVSLLPLLFCWRIFFRLELAPAIAEELPVLHQAVFKIDIGLRKRGFPINPLFMDPNQGSGRVDVIGTPP